MPTAIPDDSSLSGKAMRDQLGNTRGGATSMPTAKPSGVQSVGQGYERPAGQQLIGNTQ